MSVSFIAELSPVYCCLVNATFRCIVSKMKKEQKENKANEIEEIKSDMSKMREELGSKMDAITNILSAFQKPGV